MDERKREWLPATVHLDGPGQVALRFPIYSHLHDMNVHMRRAMDALARSAGL